MDIKKFVKEYGGIFGAVGLAVALLALLLVAVRPEEPVARTYGCDVYTEQGCSKFVIASSGEIEAQSGATVDFQSGATITMPNVTFTGTGTFEHVYSTDDAEISDALQVGSATVTGTVQAEHLYSTDDAEVADALSANSASITTTLTAADVTASDDITVTDRLEVSGITDHNGNEMILDADSDTSVTADTDDQVDVRIAGQDMISFTQSASHFLMDVYWRTPAAKKTTSYTATRAESGMLYSNMGATAEITITLPSATAGVGYCFYVADAYTITIDPATGDQVHHLTNAAGDRLQNTGTAGDSICLSAIDGTYWVPLQEIGTWSDVD